MAQWPWGKPALIAWVVFLAFFAVAVAGCELMIAKQDAAVRDAVLAAAKPRLPADIREDCSEPQVVSRWKAALTLSERADTSPALRTEHVLRAMAYLLTVAICIDGSR